MSIYTEQILFILVVLNFILSLITLFVRRKGVKISEEALKAKYTKKQLEEAQTQAFNDGINYALDAIEEG